MEQLIVQDYIFLIRSLHTIPKLHYILFFTNTIVWI